MKNSYPRWDSNPGPSAYEANALIRDNMYRLPKGDSILPECAIKSYLTTC